MKRWMLFAALALVLPLSVGGATVLAGETGTSDDAMQGMMACMTMMNGQGMSGDGMNSMHELMQSEQGREALTRMMDMMQTMHGHGMGSGMMQPNAGRGSR